MRKRIYILEDNPGTRDILEFLLTEEDYDVEACSNTRDFWNLMSRHVPDMVVLDVNLPDGNGLEICNKLKHSARTFNIPVMIMSADNYLSKVKNRCEAEDYINKPFNLNDFMGRVTHHVPC